MSIRSSFPSISPTLTLDFAKSRSLGPNIGFTRSHTGNIATYTGSEGLVKYAGPDEPRFDHRVNTRTNLFLYSEELGQSVWFKGRVAITSNAITAPDGLTSADLATENNSSTGEHYINQTGFNYENGSTYTWSWFVKPNGRDNVYCKVYTNFTTAQAIINLPSGSIYHSTTEQFNNITLEPYPDGWYRVSFTKTATSTGQGNILIGFANSSTTYSYLGDGTSGMYIWGAQVEISSAPTDYIATNAATTTRSEVESVGLLLETSRTNFITTSNMSNWNIIGFTGRSLDSVGPDGVANSAISLTEVTGTNPAQYVIYADINVSNNNQTFTHSVFVKPFSSYNWQLNAHNIGSAGNASSFSIVFNTNTRQFTAVTGGPNSPALEGYGYQELSGGWFRIWATCNVGNSDQHTSLLRFHVRPLNASQSGNYTGTGALTGYVFGAQIELGNYLTSYIPTSGSTVNRPTEVLSMTGSKNFSSFYNPTQWTLLVDQVVSKQMLLSNPASVHAYQFDDQTSNNQYILRFVSSTTNPYIDAYGKTNGVTVLDAPGDSTLWTNETVDVPVRTAFTCNQTTTKFCNDSSPVQIDGTFSLSSGVNRFFITSVRTGNVSKISYYPAALPSTQLQTLTTPKV